MGFWSTCGLGTENENLLARYQGTPIRVGRFEKVLVGAPGKIELTAFSARPPATNREGWGPDERIEARIASFELAFRTQTVAPELTDIEGEPESTRRRHGMDSKTTESFGRQCLLARRLVERGVRFVQASHGYRDQHGDSGQRHAELAAQVDRPIAGLPRDLKECISWPISGVAPG